ncbi:Sec-independent protein translocase subunit TatA [Arthrobacter sp. Sr24]
MGRLFESPWAITIIIIVVLLLFAAPKLPGMARSLGQSMRIIKSEVKEMKNDGKDEKASPAPTASAAPQAPTATAAPEAPFEGKIVNNPAQGNTTGEGTGTGTGAQS